MHVPGFHSMSFTFGPRKRLRIGGIHKTSRPGRQCDFSGHGAWPHDTAPTKCVLHGDEANAELRDARCSGLQHCVLGANRFTGTRGFKGSRVP